MFLLLVGVAIFSIVFYYRAVKIIVRIACSDELVLSRINDWLGLRALSEMKMIVNFRFLIDLVLGRYKHRFPKRHVILTELFQARLWILVYLFATLLAFLLP